MSGLVAFHQREVSYQVFHQLEWLQSGRAVCHRLLESHQHLALMLPEPLGWRLEFHVRLVFLRLE